MRAIILILALLAGAKIWIHESAYRTAAENAIVRAYQPRAAETCTNTARTLATAGLNEINEDWLSGVEAHFSVGNPALSVRIWDFDNEQWNAGFRQPYLILSAPHASSSCTFDILNGSATIARS